MKKYLALTVVLVAVFSAGPAWSQGMMQGDDPMIVLPEVFVGFDSSGSMLWGSYQGLGACNNPAYSYNDPDYCYCSTAARCNNAGLNWCRNAHEGAIWKVARWLPDNKWYWFPCDTYECNSGGRSCRVFCDNLGGGWCAGSYCDQFGASGWTGPGGIADDGITCYRNRWESAREILTGAYLDRNMNCQNQDQNGILDLYKENIRFGFGTFDDDDALNSWDYGPDTQSHRRLGLKDRCPCDGQNNSPWNCGCPNTGVNAGKLIDVVKPDAPEDMAGNNNRLQTELCSMARSNDGSSVANSSLYQSTPLAPTLYDIFQYFQLYENQINVDDPLSDCRPRYTVLFTDGQENVGSSQNVAGCAYVGGNWTNGAFYGCATIQATALCDDHIPVFVVGFGDAYSLGCPPPYNPLDPNCKINRIALAGSGANCNSGTPLLAFTASNPADLYASFQAIMNAILAGSASRTDVSSTPSLVSSENSFAYSAYFDVSLSGGWEGHLLRTPVTDLDSDGVPEWDIGSQMDFSSVLYNQNPADRKIYTVVNDPRSQTFTYPNQMPRPVDLADHDKGLWPLKDGALSPVVDWLCNADKNELSKTVNFIRGTAGATNWAGSIVRDGHPVLGDIFHSSPEVVPPPSALSPNYKYELYFLANANRPTMVYVGANDGMLHAFVGEDPVNPARVGKELWGFVPPELLAKIQKIRLGHEVFVDGTPVVRDVYFNEIPATDQGGNAILDANNHPVMGAYRTVLVSGLRGGGNAYFALDVTDPDNPRYLWEYRTEQEPAADYKANQCQVPHLQTWARPIVGQVWVKNAHAGEGNPPEPDFVQRSVAIFPGGYLPPQGMMNISSCVDFMSMMATAASLHIVDVETGKLLRKFVFSSSITQQILDDLQDYYDLLADPSTADDSWAGTFSSSDWNGGNGWTWGNNAEINNSGWFCREDRDHANTPLSLPANLQANCEVTEDDTMYQIGCCLDNNNNPVAFSNCNLNAAGWCFYRYTYFKSNGSSMVKFKGSQCSNGDFELQIGEGFAIETVAANPVAYSTAFGEYINRVFIPSTVGRIWRIDMRSGEFDRDKPEGQMVYKYTDGGGVEHDWDVGRNVVGTPVAWFDTKPYTNNTPRPITVQPALAMNASRNLVLFVGTGRIDDLTYLDTRDYILAVEETRTLTGDGFYEPDDFGKLFCNESYGPNCIGSGMPKQLSISERLFGKPLVVAGQVFFTTYEPADNDCDPGRGRVYGYRYDDFQEETLTTNNLASTGPPTQPQVVWTPQGPQLITGQASNIQVLPTETQLTTGAQVMFWGKVL